MTLYRAFRRRLCRWFSFHDQKTIGSHGEWDQTVCRHCGLRANVNPYTHEVEIL